MKRNHFTKHALALLLAICMVMHCGIGVGASPAGRDSGATWQEIPASQVSASLTNPAAQTAGFLTGLQQDSSDQTHGADNLNDGENDVQNFHFSSKASYDGRYSGERQAEILYIFAGFRIVKYMIPQNMG